jgi:2-dehydro-3-deoxyphosphogluconate aldolase/(4S)-4-hydroxy-2-oxoglutarate aldolase
VTSSIRTILNAARVLPVLTIEDTASAVPLAKAFVESGVRMLEVTMRTNVALDAVREIRARVPEAIVGAGTILTPNDVRKAMDAGAAFGVSPGTTAELLRAVRNEGWPFLPGVMTPSEIIRGLDYGFDTFKLFPAEVAGGVDYLRSLAGPFPHVKFCPTGGITPELAEEYLALDNVISVGGSWLKPTVRTGSRVL